MPCIMTRLGKDYVGTLAQTVDGDKCLKWSDVAHLGDAQYDLPEANSGKKTFDDWSNFCRNIPGLLWEQPSCFTEELPNKATPCGVPYCGWYILNIFVILHGI